MGARPLIDLLGPYVEAPPRDVALPEAGGGVGAREGTPDDLRLETGVTSRSTVTARRRSLTGAGSLFIHSVGLMATLAVPLLLVSNLPEPTGGAQVFLVAPLSIPPPPVPPPPPAPRAASVRVRESVAPDPPTSFVAPIEVPMELKLEATLDLGGEGGIAGGVEGGVPGGVVGAIVGGLPDAVTKPPPPVGPIRVGGLVREPSKIRHVPPVYPEMALAARVESSVKVEASIDVRGQVIDVEVVQGKPPFDRAALDAVRQWVYTPTLVDGVPTPVLMTITIHFRLERGRRVAGRR